MVKKKKSPVGDVTRTARAQTHLEKIKTAGGKRVVIDFDGPSNEALQLLVAKRYGGDRTQRSAVIRAVLEAAASAES
ncbi:hypothetical protein [Acidovorax sp.]|uniref:hypothetical protein n=1 Tax=Acidovorax sp. TaxID=1872122 RepID=UPI00391F0C88